MPLTAKQEAFARYIVQGHSLADAYREAYNTDNMKPATIRGEACKLAANPSVSRMVQDLKAQRDRAVMVSAAGMRAWVMERLQHEAMEAETAGARVKALELLGRVAEVDLFGTTPDDKLDRQSAAQLRKILRERIAALSPTIDGQVSPPQPQLEDILEDDPTPPVED